MTKASHPYFIANDPDRHTTAVLLTGTASEFGIDQHDIQVTQGGFNVTEAVAEALGYDVSEDDEETPDVDLTPEPIVTGTPKDGTATTAVPAEVTDTEQSVSAAGEGAEGVAEQHEPVDYSTWDYDDLKNAITARQIQTEGRSADTYREALAADDARVAAEGNDTL